jgi:hypothetical protein
MYMARSASTGHTDIDDRHFDIQCRPIGQPSDTMWCMVSALPETTAPAAQMMPKFHGCGMN